jgi:hypothetical protein
MHSADRTPSFRWGARSNPSSLETRHTSQSNVELLGHHPIAQSKTRQIYPSVVRGTAIAIRPNLALRTRHSSKITIGATDRHAESEFVGSATDRRKEQTRDAQHVVPNCGNRVRCVFCRGVFRVRACILAGMGEWMALGTQDLRTLVRRNRVHAFRHVDGRKVHSASLIILGAFALALGFWAFAGLQASTLEMWPNGYGR